MGKTSLAAKLLNARDEQLTSNSNCPVKKALDTLQPDDKEALQVAMGDPVIYGTTIAKALREEGFDIAAPAIQRHRRGVCACPWNKAKHG